MTLWLVRGCLGRNYHARWCRWVKAIEQMHAWCWIQSTMKHFCFKNAADSLRRWARSVLQKSCKSSIICRNQLRRDFNYILSKLCWWSLCVAEKSLALKWHKWSCGGVRKEKPIHYLMFNMFSFQMNDKKRRGKKRNSSSWSFRLHWINSNISAASLGSRKS